MKLPKRDYPDAIKKQKVNRIITAVTVIITLPAIYLAYTFVQQNNFNQNATKYISESFVDEGYVVIYQNVEYSRGGSTIELAVLGERFTETDMAVFNTRLEQYDLADTELVIRQDNFSLSEEEWRQLVLEVQSDDEKIAALEARVASERASLMSPSRILNEAQAFNSKLTDIAIGELNYGSIENELTAARTVITVYANEPVTQSEANQLRNWLRTRLEQEQILVYFIPEVLLEETEEEN
jgi:hypothetical protein